MAQLTDAQKELFGLKDHDESHIDKGVISVDHLITQMNSVAGKLRHMPEERVVAVVDKEFVDNNVVAILVPVAYGSRLLKKDGLPVLDISLDDFKRANGPKESSVFSGLFFGIEPKIASLTSGTAWRITAPVSSGAPQRGFFAAAPTALFYVLNYYDFRELTNIRSADPAAAAARPSSALG